MFVGAKFFYPLPSKKSIHADTLDELVKVWLEDYNILSAEQKDKMENGRFGNLAAHFFPVATYHQLVFMTRWNLTFFIFDDYYGPLPISELNKHITRATEILHGDAITSEDNEIFRQISILRQEILPHIIGNEFWWEQFCKSMQLFFEGMRADTSYSYQETVKYPSLKEYLTLREKIVATYPLLDFAEIEMQTILPSSIISHPAINRIRQLACRLVSWSNDVFSLRKEMEDHEAMNLVLVLQNEYQCSLEDATEKTIDIHEQDLIALIDLIENLNLKTFGTYAAAVHKYIYGIQLLVSGHIAWYDYTNRY